MTNHRNLHYHRSGYPDYRLHNNLEPIRRTGTQEPCCHYRSLEMRFPTVLASASTMKLASTVPPPGLLVSPENIR
ncbi:hypothetical protein ACFQ88_04265 [Paenibacillus sp. NPDC056579]|uniref:hypothetical protein n=1 Tax=unclassified Paenibacillus TaxID=185978 RepID=UPI001EF81D4C|nr:hypothetical protein [Paenibacillus sp. H1-7]